MAYNTKLTNLFVLRGTLQKENWENVGNSGGNVAKVTNSCEVAKIVVKEFCLNLNFFFLGSQL